MAMPSDFQFYADLRSLLDQLQDARQALDAVSRPTDPLLKGLHAAALVNLGISEVLIREKLTELEQCAPAPVAAAAHAPGIGGGSGGYPSAKWDGGTGGR